MSRIKIGNIKGPKGDRGETGAVGPKGEQGIQGPVGPAGGVDSVNGKKGDVNIADALGYTPAGGQGVNLLTGTKDFSGASDGIERWYKDGTYNDCVVYSKDTAWGGISYAIDVVEGEWYTFSAWIKSNAPIGILNFTTNSGNFNANNPKIENYAPNEWRRVFVNLQAKVTKLVYFRFELKENYKISICGLKAERGTVTDPVWTPAPEDVVVRSELPISLNVIFPKNAGAHNSIFRGNNLGTSVTETQYAAINNGSFDDIFVGDYWTISGKVYRVAGLDIFLHVGDTELTKHHAVIVPDINMYTHRMNETNTTAKAYQGSEMKTSGLSDALTTVQTAFDAEHILKHKVLLANATSGDNPSAWAWYESQIDLMTERQVYGSPAWGQAAHNGHDANSQYKQFPLFALAPEFICKSRAWYWLQDVRSASAFCGVNGGGDAAARGASDSGGVRPYFLIGVA